MNETINARNQEIENNGVLIRLQIKNWQGRKKIAKDDYQVATNCNKEDFTSASKRLVNAEALKPLVNLAASARNLIKGYSLPISDFEGLHFIHKSRVGSLQEQLEIIKVDYGKEIAKLEANYRNLIAESEYELGELFDLADYPEDYISDKFSFNWFFQSMKFFSNPVDGLSNIIPQELLHAETEKAKGRLESVTDDWKIYLAENLKELVTNALKKLGTQPDGKCMTFRNSKIENIKDFLAEMDTFNSLLNDGNLTELSAQIKNSLNGIDVNEIRKNRDTRDSIQTQFKAVENSLDSMLAEMPKRRLSLNLPETDKPDID